MELSFLDKVKPRGGPVSFADKAKPLPMNPNSGAFNVADTSYSKNIRQGQGESQMNAIVAETKGDNTKGGFLKNFGKAFVGTIANSQVGLGKTIAKLGGPNKEVMESTEQLQETQRQLYKRIQELDRKGVDTTKLKQTYNANISEIKKGEQSVTDFNRELPTQMQAAGQIGGTALDVLTAGTYGKAAQGAKTGQLLSGANNAAKTTATAAGAPELGQLATQQASGMFTRKGASNIATGAGLGYVSDVTQGLQGARGEDREGAKALIPGLGTALGAAIPTINEGTQSIKNVTDPNIKATNLANKRYEELDKLNQQPLRKAIEKGQARGIDIKKVLSETDVLHGSVDRNGTISTIGPDGPVENYTRQFIDGNESLVSDLLKKEGVSISPDLVKAKLTEAVKNSGIEGKAYSQALKAIDQEIDGYKLRAGAEGLIPVSTLHNAKVDKYEGINYFTEGATKKYDKTIARALKEMVEENTKSANVKEINAELAKHFAVIDYLRKLDGRKVEGGRLGKYFAQTVGAIAGSHFGPLGTVIGAEAGGMVRGGMMSRAFKGQTGRSFPDAPVIQNAKATRDAAPLELPPGNPQSNSVGTRQTTQASTIAPTTKVISDTKPQTTKAVKPDKEAQALRQSIEARQVESSRKDTISDIRKQSGNGGYIKSPNARAFFDLFKSSNPRGRNLKVEAEQAIANASWSTNQDALWVIKEWSRNKGGSGVTRGELAKALDIIKGNARRK